MASDFPPGYITGTGQVLFNVHQATEECYRLGCVVHNPTDPRPWPTHWNAALRSMDRICPHGNPHPDRNHVNFVRRTEGSLTAIAAAQHPCICGCCAQYKNKRKRKRT